MSTILRPGISNYPAHVKCALALVALSLCTINWCRRCVGQSLHTRDAVIAKVAALQWTTDGWQYASPADPKLFQPADVVRWGSWSGVQREQAVWLSDGSWLCGKLDLLSDKVVVRSDWFDPVEIPLTSLRGILLNPLPSFRDWQKVSSWMSAAEGTDDRVLLTSGQKAQGLISIIERDEEPAGLQLEKDGQGFSWDQLEVRAIVFSPALLGEIPQKSKGQSIAISDGSLLNTRAPEAFKNRFKLVTDGGVNLVSIDSAKRFAEELRYLRVHNSSTQFLSDMPVAQYKYLPKLSSLQWELGVDEDCLGRPLQVDGGVVPKGIAMHAPSQVAFRWDKSAARLLGEVGFVVPPAGSSKTLGAVACKVLVARSGKLQTVGEFKLHRAGHDRVRSSSLVDIDVTDAQLIVLVVEEDQFGQLGDHIQWLDLRLERQEK